MLERGTGCVGPGELERAFGTYVCRDKGRIEDQQWHLGGVTAVWRHLSVREHTGGRDLSKEHQ